MVQQQVLSSDDLLNTQIQPVKVYTSSEMIGHADIEKPGAQGFVGNVVQGATFNTGGLLSGIANIAAMPAEKLGALITGQKVADKTIPESFKEGKEAFEKPTEEFAQEHPVLATGAQIAGGVVPAIMTGGLSDVLAGKTILQKMGRGVVEGSKFGAAYGAGGETGNVAEAELEQKPVGPSILDMVTKTATGAEMGAIIGGATPIAGGILKGGFNLLKNVFFPLRAAVDTLRKAAQQDIPSVLQFSPQQMESIGFKPSGVMAEASKNPAGFNPKGDNTGNINVNKNIGEGDTLKPVDVINSQISPDKIKNSFDTNTPLLFQTDPDGAIHNLAIEAKLNSPEASKILTAAARQKMENQPSEIIDAVNSVLGDKNHFQNADEIREAYTAKAAPAYDAAYKYGDLAQHDPSISDFITNEDQLQDAIKTARKVL